MIMDEAQKIELQRMIDLYHSRICRGKCKTYGGVDGEWVYGGLVYCESKKSKDVLIVNAIKKSVMLHFPVIPESVGWFVCKYKDFYIFEGDIIHIILGDNSARDFGVVTYSQKNGNFFVDDTFGEIPKDGGKTVGEFLSSVEQLKFKDRHPEIYIKGNIFDRPELKKNVEPLPF